MRGVQVLEARGLPALGNTPARAGSTDVGATVRLARQEHPRACGEYVSTRRSPPTPSGTPPRVRGVRPAMNRVASAGRNTPARAGSTAFVSEAPTVPPGTPPRVRGVHGSLHQEPRVPGNTPARAGSTGAWRPSLRRRGEHPRACGEYEKTLRYLLRTSGTPPRVRGVQAQRDQDRHLPGNTPARAGSTATRVLYPNDAREHPRACGEYSTPLLARGFHLGTPPRVRGVFLP